MGTALTKIINAFAIACALGMGSLSPAFAGSAGAADSRGPERPLEGGGQRNDAGGSERAVPHGQREGNWRGNRGGGDSRGWREGEGDAYRHEGGFGWAPFVFGGLAAGALAESATPRFEGEPYDGDPCYRLTPTYDQWNNYIGRQWVDVCE